MYWLLDDKNKEAVRNTITSLVAELAEVQGSSQSDQLFPFVGRKDRKQAKVIISHLSQAGDTVVDPFSGSGIFSYAATELNRRVCSNEWEPYTHRISTAPWRLPASDKIARALTELEVVLKPQLDELYKTICVCGHEHVLDSLFFDRVPLTYRDVTRHERLGENGENVTYRGKNACPVCGVKEKFFDDTDEEHLNDVDSRPIPDDYQHIFETSLIPNSRINLTGEFTVYGNLFPHRSKLALVYLWRAVTELNADVEVKEFFFDAILSILPQAKYKDYRSKSQDLHVPERQLREVNLFYRFVDQAQVRENGLRAYSFHTSNGGAPLKSLDYRQFLSEFDTPVSFVFTDPPWTDGNAYFEKAQLYHPWIGYSLVKDNERMKKEFVVTDAPSRHREHDLAHWWVDMESYFHDASQINSDLGYMALFFRPIPASQWLQNLNRLKLLARKAGYEPLLTVDASSNDPSMRIQQSASFVFSADVVFVFLKLPEAIQRQFIDDVDMDYLAFKAAVSIQETKRDVFSYREWREKFAQVVIDEGVGRANLPAYEPTVRMLFNRYCDLISGQDGYLPKADTPFSGQLFDIPAIERLFTYVPVVIGDITRKSPRFTYDMFLLKLAEYVENGTRMLIDQVQEIDIKGMLMPYASPIEGGKLFTLRRLPQLPNGIKNIMELDPYEFETFTATLLTRQGYTSVAVIGHSGDRGVDVVATDPDGAKVVVQCKRYLRENVSATPIQRLHSFAITRGANRRIVITTSDFTPDAIDEAHNTDTQLINGQQLETLVATYMPDFIQSQN
jgi:16S rRNA G966 N2-methylase RsmD